MPQPKFSGVIVPLITPFKEDFSIDLDGIRWLTNFLVKKGVNGIFPYSTTGEFVHLKIEEGVKITEIVLQECKGKTKVIPGISANTTLDCIEIGKKMEDLGADGVIATPPFFFKLKKENLYKHFSMIASKISISLIVYNIPDLTGNLIPIELYSKLAEEYSNIAGAKVTYDSASYLRDLILELKAIRKDFAILTGLDDMLLATLLLGGDGGIMACANFAPQLHIGLYNAFHEKNYEKAFEFNKKIAKLVQIYKYASSFPSAIKAALKLLGTPIKNIVRPPLSPEPPEIEAKIRAILHELGMIK